MLEVDNPGIRLAASDYLEISGYAAITAKNSKQALEMLEKNQLYLILADVTARPLRLSGERLMLSRCFRQTVQMSSFATSL